ncbi:MAG: hypothetical protein A3C47_03830 [Omnitrophica bacterium RIFCSPHIGHO2_02_FULL_51_18]|nr:MAG: hypothetical protein A3C47_03830 [Omnitrophica bacterium RIFCSPHIGHO2_02_FULL_51_18]
MKELGFKNLLRSINQARAIRAGKHKPGRVIRFEPIRLKAVRRKLHVSQSEFARFIGVSPATLRNWEQGRTYPEGAARALLAIAAKRPDAILEALRAA